MSSGIHCDGPACDTWAFIDPDHTKNFLTMFDGVSSMYATMVLHFCSWECVLGYADSKTGMGI